MKTNISLALNAILLIAVAYLLSQHLSGGKGESQPAGESASSAAGLHIVYINADTLLEKYDYFQEQSAALGQREREATERLGQRGQALEQEFRAVQQRVQQGLMTPKQIAEEEQRLGRKQQALMAEREQLSQQLMAETQRINEELYNRLRELMDSMREEEGYDYILQYGQGSSVLLASDSLDITTEVLEMLNAETPEKPESDSTAQE